MYHIRKNEKRIIDGQLNSTRQPGTQQKSTSIPHIRIVCAIT